ncbi:hypothetical protein AD45P4_00345 [Alteromonas phage vB_AmaP_AD45-P4]|nr:hypothetical protein AD45P3_00350 [Alteromonas phage vB_AmaP_AD45-P3]AGM47124.1 hypothetical protein AD45P4_00345 [Alteromonas phage vB_AmaP_AD45-P4]
MNQTRSSCRISRLTQQLKESKKREAELHKRCLELIQEAQTKDSIPAKDLNIFTAEKQTEAIKVFLEVFVETCTEHKIPRSDPTLRILKKTADKVVHTLQKRLGH